MPNFAAALKAEILRLSRKTVKQHLSPVRSINAAQRRHIAALRRQVGALQRELAVVRKAALSRPAAPSASAETPARFVARGLVSLRARLGLSAEDFGKLVGVSGVSVYNWEHKKAKPRPSVLSAIAALRTVGKREAKARLAQLAPRNAQPGKIQRKRRRK